jgi:hypothetical protein
VTVTPGDPVVGSTVLRRPAIQSPNYVQGVSGWSINADGSAEFNDLTIRGTFEGANFIINSSGEFFYEPSVGAGNLVVSNASAAGTDGSGNHYLAGAASYGSGFACALLGGALLFYTGSLAGGWAEQGQLLIDSGGDFLVDFANAVTDGNLTVDGTFSNSGSTGSGQPAGSPTGGPNSGTFAGHTHDFEGHTHPL